MANWNYEKAVAFIAAIEDPTSKRITKLFLDQLLIAVSRQKISHEGDFDLLFFTQAINEVALNVELINSAIEGLDDDGGWELIAKELSKP